MSRTILWRGAVIALGAAGSATLAVRRTARRHRLAEMYDGFWAKVMIAVGDYQASVRIADQPELDDATAAEIITNRPNVKAGDVFVEPKVEVAVDPGGDLGLLHFTVTATTDEVWYFYEQLTRPDGVELDHWYHGSTPTKLSFQIRVFAQDNPLLQAIAERVARATTQTD